MIKKIQFKNVKGGSHSYDLSPLTVICGQNASGKTSVLDCIDWLTLGYLPKLRTPDSKGVPNATMFKICSGQFMEATIETERGVSSRRLEKRTNRKGDVEYSATATNVLDFPPILRDYSLYTTLSTDAKIKYVAGLVRLSDVSEFSTNELLAGVLNINLGDSNSESSEVAKRSIYQTLGELPTAEPLDWIAEALKTITESGKLAKQSQKRFTETGIGITQLQALDNEQVVSGGAIESNLQTARKRLGELQTEAGQLAFSVNDQKQKHQRRIDLEAIPKPDTDLAALNLSIEGLAKRIADGRRHVNSRLTPTNVLFAAVARLESEQRAADAENTRIATRRNVLKAIQLPVGTEELRKRAAALELKQNQWRDGIAARPKTSWQITEELALAKSARDAKAKEYTGTKAAITAKESEIAKEKESAAQFLTAQECCPMCDAAGAEWKTRWKAKSDAEVKTLVGCLAQLIVKLDAATMEGTRLKTLCGSLELTLVRMQADDKEAAGVDSEFLDVRSRIVVGAAAVIAHTNAQVELAELATQDAACQALKEKLQKELESAQTAHQKAAKEDSTLAGLEQQHKDALEQLSIAKDAQTSWTNVQAELATLAGVNLAQAQAAHARQQEAVEKQQAIITELETKMRAVTLSRADLKRQLDAVKAAEAAQASVDVHKAVKELLEEKQAALVATAFKSLLVTLNKFTSVVIENPIVYHDGQIGYFADGSTFVSASTFSGIEELITFVGLCVSLASQAEQKVVLIDELTRAIGDTKERVLRRLFELTQDGTIAQAIVVDGPSEIYDAAAQKSKDITVINVK
jgi:hypothetical protein